MWERPHTSFHREFHFFPPLLSGSAKQNFLPSHQPIPSTIITRSRLRDLFLSVVDRKSIIFSRSKVSSNLTRLLRNELQWKYSVGEEGEINEYERLFNIFNVAIDLRRGKISSLIFFPSLFLSLFLLPIDNFWYYLSQNVVWLRVISNRYVSL